MGFIGDLFSGNKQNQIANTINPESAGTQNFQPTIDQAAQQFNTGQNMLLQQAQGQGPNPALAQLQQTTDMNARQASGMVSSQKGLNPALAARLGMEQQAMTNQQANAQAATLAAQQQLGAQQLYGQNAQGMYNSAQSANASQGQRIIQAQADRASVAAGGAKQQGQGIGGAINSLGQAGAMAAGLPPGAAPKMSEGGEVPGEAEVEGDSEANDKVHALLSPGEAVIPRSAMQSEDKAVAFIRALMAHKEQEEPKGYGKVLSAKRKAKKG